MGRICYDLSIMKLLKDTVIEVLRIYRQFL